MKARILVIEDEPAINNLLCMNLEVTGYQTVSYLDGNDASEGIAWDHEFQCALVDIMLPGQDGYNCLMMFVRNPNKALTREQLLAGLWGVEFEGETRTVDAHVGRIRKKLGWQNRIKTIPRIGYRLEVEF